VPVPADREGKCALESQSILSKIVAHCSPHRSPPDADALQCPARRIELCLLAVEVVLPPGAITETPTPEVGRGPRLSSLQIRIRFPT
jgi:hypothetical protein